MRGYNSGWCGSCGCNSCDCACGRKTVIQQSSSSCCNTSAGTRFCKEPWPYLTGNFTIPVANEEVEVKVSNSTKLYEGEGIRIGDGFFQIKEIVDSTTIIISHDGTATPGLAITAINAAYGCYTYPIYYVGIVELSYTPDAVEGLDTDLDPIADSVIDPEVVFTYGYLGPNKIQFNFEVDCEIDNVPHFLSVPLPNASSEPSAAFSAYIYLSGVPYPAVAWKQGADLVVGLGSGTSYPNEEGVVVKVSGSYGV